MARRRRKYHPHGLKINIKKNLKETAMSHNIP